MSVISLHQEASRPLTERVAEEVRALMARKGVTQMRLSQVLMVSQTGVSKRLRGKIAFDVNEMGILADFFDVDPTELLGATKNPRPGPDGGSRGDTGRARGVIRAYPPLLTLAA